MKLVKRMARIVGLLYLVIFFVGPFAFFLGRTGVVVPGDPAATVDNLMASEAFTVWLLWKGVNVEQYEKRVLEAA